MYVPQAVLEAILTGTEETIKSYVVQCCQKQKLNLLILQYFLNPHPTICFMDFRERRRRRKGKREKKRGREALMYERNICGLPPI